MERRLAAILAADVVGYSRLMGADEAGTLAAMRVLRIDTIEPLVASHRGRIVKLMGDGVLVEFASVVDAVECALAWQMERQAAEDQTLRFRIGVNLGDIIFEDNDIHGDGVNLAARLESFAEPGKICISAVVHDQINRRIDASFIDLGDQELKNIDRPVRVWQWSPEASNGDASIQTEPSLLSLSEKPSIAVLPFNNMSNDPEQEYFSDGITEDIITEISRIPEVMVISRNSTFTYKDKAAKIQDVCRDLGVRYVLEGSVRKAGERVRISAQLIEGSSGGHLWAERYDRGLEDIFAVQDDVTEKIVRALEINLVGGAAAHEARDQTHDPEAYDCVLRGREQYRLFSKDSNAAARQLYERAITLDPNYAEPYAGLAETYVQDWFIGTEPTLDRAFELAQQAVARDPTLPIVHEALSTVHLFKKQHAEAIATARRWIELEPSNADAYPTLAGALHFAGENDEVIALINKAMRLNPFYPFYYPHYIGLANFGMRRLDDAVVAFKRGVARSPDALWPHVFLAVCHGHLGDDALARAQLAEVRRINPEFSIASLPDLLPYKNSADIDLVIDGLRNAGLSK